MITHIVIASSVTVGLFVMFLVISRTLNTMINMLGKLEYYMRKDLEHQQRLLEERRELDAKRRPAGDDSDAAEGRAQGA